MLDDNMLLGEVVNILYFTFYGICLMANLWHVWRQYATRRGGEYLMLQLELGRGGVGAPLRLNFSSSTYIQDARLIFVRTPRTERHWILNSTVPTPIPTGHQMKDNFYFWRRTLNGVASPRTISAVFGKYLHSERLPSRPHDYFIF